MLDFIILYIPKYIYVYMENKNQKTVKTGVEEPVNRTPELNKISLTDLDMSCLKCALLEAVESNTKQGYPATANSIRDLYNKIKEAKN